MVQKGAAAQAEGPRSAALYRSGGIAAMLVTATLLIGLAGLPMALPGLGLRNWLVVLFQINSGAGVLPADPLRVFNLLDFALLIFSGVVFLGLWPVLARVNWILMGIAVTLPFAGIAVLVATDQSGRSSVMGAGLLIALLMLISRGFKPLGFLGIPANALLLVGDFGTSNSDSNIIIAILIGVGYVLLMTWFFLIGRRLFQMAV